MSKKGLENYEEIGKYVSDGLYKLSAVTLSKWKARSDFILNYHSRQGEQSSANRRFKLAGKGMMIFPDQEQQQGTFIPQRRAEAFQQQEQYVAWGLGSTLWCPVDGAGALWSYRVSASLCCGAASTRGTAGMVTALLLHCSPPARSPPLLESAQPPPATSPSLPPKNPVKRGQLPPCRGSQLSGAGGGPAGCKPQRTAGDAMHCLSGCLRSSGDGRRQPTRRAGLAGAAHVPAACRRELIKPEPE